MLSVQTSKAKQISMGNQAEQIEDDRGVEKSRHEAQAYDRPLPEVVVATSGDAEINDSEQSLKRNEKLVTNGLNPSPSEDEGFEGDPNLIVPQYEYPDGGDETEYIDNVDVKGHPNLVVSQSNNTGGEGEAKAHDEGNGGVPKEKKQPQHQTPIGLGEAKKPKKKRKARSKRGVAAPSGFEEYYVDVPILPAEYEEEKGIYHESVNFYERIETAIQRYHAKRNFNCERRDVFDKYMSYGGISAGPNMFAGVDMKKAEGTAAEIAALRATHYIPLGRGQPDDPDFVVDFESCAKGFFSSRLPVVWELTEPRTKIATAIVRNFLNYILHHDVCPEYNDQIYAARNICDKAERELSHLAKAQIILPGEFNRACSIIFGGSFHGTYIGDQEWAKDLEMSDQMSPETARKVFKIALVAYASEEIWEKYNAQSEAQSIHVTEEFDASFEVTDLIAPSNEVLNIYKTPVAIGTTPVGKMRAKTWFNPNDYEKDLTEEEEQAELAARAIKESDSKDEYEFWIDEDLLSCLHVGTKMTTKVHRTSFGVEYFDLVQATYCSFYTLLPNEEILGWREPGPRLPYRKPMTNEGLTLIPGNGGTVRDENEDETVEVGDRKEGLDDGDDDLE